MNMKNLESEHYNGLKNLTRVFKIFFRFLNQKNINKKYERFFFIKKGVKVE